MSTEKNLNNLVINKVENQTVYDYMKANNLINPDELYMVNGQDEAATPDAAGLMSAEDKTKLDGIQAGARVNVQSDWNDTSTASDAYIKNKPAALPADGGNADTVNGHTVNKDVPADAVFTDTVYNHPSYDTHASGLYKVTVDNTGHVSAATAVTKADIVALGIPGEAASTDGLATETYVDEKVAGLVDTAPAALDTLNELAAALGDDPNFATTVATQIGEKVDKIEGKGLSTNDYTNEEKAKLASIEEGANNYIHPTQVPYKQSKLYQIYVDELGHAHVNRPGIASDLSAVSYGGAQTLTDEQKTQARENIGAQGAIVRPAGTSYLTFSSDSPFTIKINGSVKYWDGSFQYFNSSGDWVSWLGVEQIQSITSGNEQVIYLRGTGNTKINGNNNQNRYWIITGANVKCTGNIETLLDYATVESGNHPSMSNYCYAYMFFGCKALIQAPELPATTLTIGCYMNMFQGTGLIITVGC